MNVWKVLAQLSPADQWKVLIALGIMMVLVVVGGFGILMFRRRLWGEEEDDNSSDVGFSLSDLREMRDRGEITPEEYEITRARVIAKVKSSLAGPPKKGGGKGKGLEDESSEKPPPN